MALKKTKKRQHLYFKKFRLKTHGKSDQGMQTSVWGPLLWTFLHIVSFNFPVHPDGEKRLQHKLFFDSLANILPCRFCRENLPKNMIAAGYSDQVYASRDTLSKFVWRLHNVVNDALGKPKELDFEKVAAKFELIRASCKNSDTIKNVKKEKGCLTPVGNRPPTRCLIQIRPRDMAKIKSSLHFRQDCFADKKSCASENR